MESKVREIKLDGNEVVFVIDGSNGTSAQFAQFCTGTLGIIPKYERTPSGDFRFVFPITVKGFLIQSQDEQFLTDKLFWYYHEQPTDAFVHSAERLEVVRAAAADWRKKPIWLYPAEYTTEGGTRITGEKIPF